MIASFPYQFAWILIPWPSVAASFEKRREFFVRKLVFIHAGVTFGDAIISEKLNQNDVITLLVDLGSDAVFVGKMLVGRFSEEIGDLAFAIAEGREHLAAQGDNQRGC